MSNRNGNCQSCGASRSRLQRDHIVPRFEGGTNSPDNIQLLCANCHEDKTIEERKRVDQTKNIAALREWKSKPSFQKKEQQRRKKLSRYARMRVQSIKGRAQLDALHAVTRTRRYPNRLGIPLTEETKAKMSKALTGQKRSKETRQRISLALKKYWAAKEGAN